MHSRLMVSFVIPSIAFSAGIHNSHYAAPMEHSLSVPATASRSVNRGTHRLGCRLVRCAPHLGAGVADLGVQRAHVGSAKGCRHGLAHGLPALVGRARQQCVVPLGGRELRKTAKAKNGKLALSLTGTVSHFLKAPLTAV